VRYWHYQVFVEQRTLLSTPLMEQEELVEPKNYHNSVALALGLLHRVTPTVTVMMGVQRDYSPVPQQSVGLENPVGDRLGIATGLRWQLRPDLRLGLGILRNWFDMMDIQDSITTPPTNAKGHGGITSMTFDVDWRL
jgi:long-subunit fatty acid transport protein